MNLSSRDRNLLIGIIVIGVVLGYWFLLLSPKNKDASDLKTQIETAQTERDAAVQSVQRARAARTSFAADYATVVRLGKAVPETVDMPSFLVQLESAAEGTNIDFLSITAGPRAAATAPAEPVIPQDDQGQASSGVGAQRDNAQGAVDTANQASQQAGQDPSETTPSTTPAPEPAAASPTPAPGLDAVPLDFTFSGSYFDLADFLHRLKRFVRLTGPDGNRILVRGRLMVLDGITYATSAETFPQLNATVKATVYLSPKAEGTTAGASPTGPAPATQPAGTTGPAGTTPAGTTPAGTTP